MGHPFFQVKLMLIEEIIYVGSQGGRAIVIDTVFSDISENFGHFGLLVRISPKMWRPDFFPIGSRLEESEQFGLQRSTSKSCPV